MNTEWVDPIKRLINDHEEVTEYAENLKEMLTILNNPEILDKINSIKGFFDRNLVEHFAFEEDIIFPVIKSKIVTKHTELLIHELLVDHDILKAGLKDFTALFDSSMLSHSNEFLVEMSKIGQGVTERLLRHAAREDDELLPILREHIELFKNAMPAKI
jgi:iron-sulfur cluster repair protein YtfE (RIC family)